MTDTLSPLAGAGLDTDDVGRVVSETLTGADDGELFVEQRQTESLLFDDGCLKSAATDFARGFGLRAVSGETVGYTHSSEARRAQARR